MDDLFADLFAFHGLSLMQRLENALEGMAKIWYITAHGVDDAIDMSEDLYHIRQIAEEILKQNDRWKEG